MVKYFASIRNECRIPSNIEGLPEERGGMVTGGVLLGAILEVVFGIS